MHARTSSSKVHGLGFRIVNPCDAYDDAEVFKQITPLLPFGADNGGISKGSFQRKFKREPTWGIQPTCLRTRKTLNLSMPRLKYFRRWAMVSPINAIFSYPKYVLRIQLDPQGFRDSKHVSEDGPWARSSSFAALETFRAGEGRFQQLGRFPLEISGISGTNQLDDIRWVNF